MFCIIKSRGVRYASWLFIILINIHLIIPIAWYNNKEEKQYEHKRNRIFNQKYDLKSKTIWSKFFNRRQYCKKIAETIDPEPKATVIEIGPGSGSLTKHLSHRFEKVLCYEIDSQMVDILRQEMHEDNIYISIRIF